MVRESIYTHGGYSKVKYFVFWRLTTRRVNAECAGDKRGKLVQNNGLYEIHLDTSDREECG